MMVSFCAVLFPRGVLDEILNLIESVYEGFPSYSLSICLTHTSRHRGICNCVNSGSSLNPARAALVNDSVSSSCQSSPAINICCNSILALMVNGAKKPTGSKSVAICFRKLRFVYFTSLLGAFFLNVKTSLSDSHHTLSIFVLGK